MNARAAHKMFREAEERGLVEIGLNRSLSFKWWSRNTLSGGLLSRIIRLIPGLAPIAGPYAERASEKKVLKRALRSPKAFEELYSCKGIYLINRKKRKNIIESPSSWEGFIVKVMNPGKEN